jgi:predicted nucleotidyltransferase
MADPSDLAGLAAAISADLTAAGIVHALSGSLSMAAYARPRATLDADFLVITPAIRWPEVFRIARKHGFDGDDRECISSIRTQGHAMLSSGPIALDILVPQIPYHHEVAKRAHRLSLEGHEVPFVTAEDLFVLKTVWWRKKDELDLAVLADGTRGTLDVDYVRRTVASLLPENDPRHAAIETLLTASP